MKGSKQLLTVSLCVTLVGWGLATASLRAQSEDAPGSKRHVKFLGKPAYPDLARKLNLAGTVKVEVVVGTDGKVKRTRIVGGNPVFTVEAEKAAGQSEFDAGPRETTEVIEFKFAP